MIRNILFLSVFLFACEAEDLPGLLPPVDSNNSKDFGGDNAGKNNKRNPSEALEEISDASFSTKDAGLHYLPDASENQTDDASVCQLDAEVLDSGLYDAGKVIPDAGKFLPDSGKILPDAGFYDSGEENIDGGNEDDGGADFDSGTDFDGDIYDFDVGAIDSGMADTDACACINNSEDASIQNDAGYDAGFVYVPPRNTSDAGSSNDGSTVIPDSGLSNDSGIVSTPDSGQSDNDVDSDSDDVDTDTGGGFDDSDEEDSDYDSVNNNPGNNTNNHGNGSGDDSDSESDSDEGSDDEED